MSGVIVAVCTTGRSNLPRTVESIVAASLESPFSLDILVVANTDDRGVVDSIKAIMAGIESSSRIYVIQELAKGIPQARNRALEWAIEEDYEYLAFIDDDCLVGETWAQKILPTLFESQSHDVVAGGWILLPESKPSKLIPSTEWGRKDYLIRGRRAADGDALPHAYTRNVVFRLKSSRVGELNVRFDEGRKEIGGSDVIFFAEIVRRGGTIVYCRDALVTEVYEGERLHFSWHLRRKIRNAQFLMERSRRGESVAFSRSPSGIIAGTIFYLAGGRNVAFVHKPRNRNESLLEFVGTLGFFLAYLWGVFSLVTGSRWREYRT